MSMNDVCLYLLLSLTVPEAMCRVLSGFIHVSDSNPVRIGDTATFPCSGSRSLYYYYAHTVVWRVNRTGTSELRLEPGPGYGLSCDVRSTAPILEEHTFEHTCDKHHNIFTLSVVGVTSKDIEVNNVWCCRLIYNLADTVFDCGEMLKAPDWNVTRVTTTPRSTMTTTNMPTTTEIGTTIGTTTPTHSGSGTMSEVSTQFGVFIVAASLWLVMS